MLLLLLFLFFFFFFLVVVVVAIVALFASFAAAGRFFTAAADPRQPKARPVLLQVQRRHPRRHRVARRGFCPDGSLQFVPTGSRREGPDDGRDRFLRQPQGGLERLRRGARVVGLLLQLLGAPGLVGGDALAPRGDGGVPGARGGGLALASDLREVLVDRGVKRLERDLRGWFPPVFSLVLGQREGLEGVVDDGRRSRRRRRFVARGRGRRGLLALGGEIAPRRLDGDDGSALLLLRRHRLVFSFLPSFSFFSQGRFTHDGLAAIYPILDPGSGAQHGRDFVVGKGEAREREVTLRSSGSSVVSCFTSSPGL